MFSKRVRGNGEFFELRDLIELWFKAIMYRVFENVRKSMKFKYRDGKTRIIIYDKWSNIKWF